MSANYNHEMPQIMKVKLPLGSGTEELGSSHTLKTFDGMLEFLFSKLYFFKIY